MPLLITGGAGFIGSNLVFHALEHTADRIVIVDKLTYAGSLLNLEGALSDPRVTFVQADIADRDAMARVFADAQPTAILNLAAETHVDRSIDGPRVFIDTNIVGTFVLLETARQFVASLPDAARGAFRFLHVSTDEVYGTLGAIGSVQRGDAVRAELAVRGEQGVRRSPGARLFPHVRAAGAADQLLEQLRAAAVSGKADSRSSRSTRSRARPLPIYGDGGNVRDWLHVDDHCAGILLVLRTGRVGEKYNIGGGSERSNVQVVDAICDALEERRPAAANPALAGGRSRRIARSRHSCPTGPATIAATPSTPRRFGENWAGSRGTRSKPASAKPSAGISITATGARPSRQGRYDRGRLGLGS